MQPKQKKKLPLPFIIAIGLLAATALVAAFILLWPWLQKLAQPATQAQLKTWVESMGAGGWLLLFGVQVLQIVIAFIPGEPVEILAGLLYGTWGGLLLCSAGCILASAMVFALSRRFGLPLLHRLFGKEKVEGFAFLQNSQRLEAATFLLFLIPGTPKDMLTYVAGATKLPMSKFLLISTFARIPSVITSTMIGASVSQGAFGLTIAVFVVTALLGILGIRYKDRMINYCKKLEGKMRARKPGAQGKGQNPNPSQGQQAAKLPQRASAKGKATSARTKASNHSA